ncbi:MAG TPA: hypothetical protein ENI86_13425 [Acidimicrobiales bacterium]|nr:hypothetical protein [Acidimicrobiales bacterium]
MRLRRDLIGMLFGGPVGGVEVYLLFLGGLSLALTIGAGSLVGIVFTTVSFGLWLLLQQVRVELRDDCLVAGHRIHPLKLKRTDIERAEIGKVWWGRGYARGIKLILKNGKRLDMPLSAILLADRLDDWITAINQWAGYEPETVDPTAAPLGRFLSSTHTPHDNSNPKDTENQPPEEP